MASLRELFPNYNPKKIQRNFIKENIRTAKGCAQCIAERRATENIPAKLETRKVSVPAKCSGQQSSKIPPSFKCNVKIVKRERSSSRNKRSHSSDRSRVELSSRGCQTDSKPGEGIALSTTCENCGYSLNLNDNSPSPTFRENEKDIVEKTISNENADNQIRSLTKGSHEISHQNEQEKRESISRKYENPASYKKGEVPRYLKERNAKLERDKQERETREKLEELLGFKDPKCPPGHMLMPPEELQRSLNNMETKFNTLIAELNRMPVSNDSYKIRQRTIQIEKELNDLEEKIELYKTKKVFVRIPDLK